VPITTAYWFPPNMVVGERGRPDEDTGKV